MKYKNIKMYEEPKYTTVQISAKLYAGFQYKIPTDVIKNMKEEDIIQETKTYMKNFFNSHNLYLLSEKIDNLELHCHDTEYDKKVIYLCDHCHT